MLFRAVERIRLQLPSADQEMKRYLGEELLCLRRLGEQYIDHWMTLEDQISDLVEGYQLVAQTQSAAPGVSLHILQGGSTSIYVHEEESKQPLDIHNRTAPAESFLIEGDGEDADFTSFGWNHSDSVTVAFRKGLAYYDLFMFADAAKSLEEVVNDLDTPVARLYLAASYAAQEMADAAMNQLTMIRRATDDPLFLCAANEIEAQLYIAQENFAAAIIVLRQITDSLPKYADAWFNLTICYTSLGRYDWAEEAAVMALRLDPTDVESAVLLGTVRLKMGNLITASATCQAALKEHPQHVELQKLSAHIAKHRGDYEAAIATCRELVARVQHQTDVWSLLSWLYVKTGDNQKALLTLKRQLTLQPQNSSALLQLGIVSLLSNEMEQAERILLRCLAHHPNKSLVWIGLGIISFGQGLEPQAHTRFLRATKDTRKDVKRLALYLYGKALLKANRYLEAEKFLKAASVLGETNPAILLALAQTVTQLGRTLEAEKLAAKAHRVSRQADVAANSQTQPGRFC
jgi:tetratricopeptide (TPR) repeat protein